MKISDLQAYLARVKRKHGDIEVIEMRYSDYGTMGTLPVGVDVSDPMMKDEGVNWSVVMGPWPNGEWA